MSTQEFSATFSRNDANMVIFESIDDPQGQYGEFGVPAPPVPGPEVLVPAAMFQAGIILARVHRSDEDVHAFVRDVQVGEETLVVNPILNAEDGTDEESVLDDAVDDAIEAGGGVDDAEANADVQVGLLQDSTPLLNPSSPPVSVTPDGELETANCEEMHILDQISRPTPGVDTKFTATIGSFGYSTTTPMVISVHKRLLEPTLEAVNRAARVLEKSDGESEEEPVRKRQVVEKDSASTP